MARFQEREGFGRRKKICRWIEKIGESVEDVSGDWWAAWDCGVFAWQVTGFGARRDQDGLAGGGD